MDKARKQGHYDTCVQRRNDWRRSIPQGRKLSRNGQRRKAQKAEGGKEDIPPRLRSSIARRALLQVETEEGQPWRLCRKQAQERKTERRNSDCERRLGFSGRNPNMKGFGLCPCSHLAAPKYSPYWKPLNAYLL